MAQWNKLGNLFCPDKNHEWMYSHAANPFAVFERDNLFKVYFTCRDINNVSSIAWVLLDMQQLKVIEVCDKPVLSPGEPGMFDDSGVAMGFYMVMDQVPHIYYLGWNLKVTVPWLNTIGLARFDKEKNAFIKVSKAPIMDRSNEDPFSISYPSVLFEDGKYKMWYGSNLSWGKKQEDMKHVFKYAESKDGYNWLRQNQIVLDLENDHEYALSKPFVIKQDGLYKMWYSYRGGVNANTYRIGFADSVDSKNWIRKDKESGIDISDAGWDSEMICYPCVFTFKGESYMLYNGNGYGKTGFGIAKLKL